MDAISLLTLLDEYQVNGFIKDEVLQFLFGEYTIKVPYVSVSYDGNFEDISVDFGKSQASKDNIRVYWKHKKYNKYTEDLVKQIVSIGYSYYGFSISSHSPFTSGNQRTNSRSTDLKKNDGVLLLYTKCNDYYDIKLIFNRNNYQEIIDISLLHQTFDKLSKQFGSNLVNSSTFTLSENMLPL